MPKNPLANETTPTLLQHAITRSMVRVGTVPLDRAKREDSLILLIIGYAACQWCHVMDTV